MQLKRITMAITAAITIFAISLTLFFIPIGKLTADSQGFCINDLTKNVYYVYGENKTTWVASTGFALEYNGKFYLITAGHVLDNDHWGLHKNLSFKANGSNTWVHPQLISYCTDYMNKRDYAIFYSDKVRSGLKIDFENDNDAFILGSSVMGINIIRDSCIANIEGESGSPIIDNEGEVTGVSTTNPQEYHTDISTVLEEINK